MEMEEDSTCLALDTSRPQSHFAHNVPRHHANPKNNKGKITAKFKPSLQKHTRLFTTSSMHINSKAQTLFAIKEYLSRTQP